MIFFFVQQFNLYLSFEHQKKKDVAYKKIRNNSAAKVEKVLDIQTFQAPNLDEDIHSDSEVLQSHDYYETHRM